MMGFEHVFVVANPLYCRIVGRWDLVGKAYLDAFPERAPTGAADLLDRVYRTGEPFVSLGLRIASDRAGTSSSARFTPIRSEG